VVVAWRNDLQVIAAKGATRWIPRRAQQARARLGGDVGDLA